MLPPGLTLPPGRKFPSKSWEFPQKMFDPPPVGKFSQMLAVFLFCRLTLEVMKQAY